MLRGCNIDMNKKSSKKIKLLIVDDEPDILSFLKMFLCKRGYDVDTAKNGLIALDKIKKGNYRILITNLRMPKMDGMSLLREAKKIKPDLIRIVHSGLYAAEKIKEAIKLGCFAYITKPSELEQMTTIINMAVVMRRIDGTILLSTK